MDMPLASSIAIPLMEFLLPPLSLLLQTIQDVDCPADVLVLGDGIRPASPMGLGVGKHDSRPG